MADSEEENAGIQSHVRTRGHAVIATPLQRKAMRRTVAGAGGVPSASTPCELPATFLEVRVRVRVRGRREASLGTERSGVVDTECEALSCGGVSGWMNGCLHQVLCYLLCEAFGSMSLHQRASNGKGGGVAPTPWGGVGVVVLVELCWGGGHTSGGKARARHAPREEHKSKNTGEKNTLPRVTEHKLVNQRTHVEVSRNTCRRGKGRKEHKSTWQGTHAQVARNTCRRVKEHILRWRGTQVDVARNTSRRVRGHESTCQGTQGDVSGSTCLDGKELMLTCQGDTCPGVKEHRSTWQGTHALVARNPCPRGKEHMPMMARNTVRHGKEDKLGWRGTHVDVAKNT